MNINNRFLMKNLLKMGLFLTFLVSFNSSYSEYVNQKEATQLTNDYINKNLQYIPNGVKPKIKDNALRYASFVLTSSPQEQNYRWEDITYYLAQLANLNAKIKTNVVGNISDAYLALQNQYYGISADALLHVLLISYNSEPKNLGEYSKIIEQALKTSFNPVTGFFNRDKNDPIKLINAALKNQKTTEQLLQQISDKRKPILDSIGLILPLFKDIDETLKEPANIKTLNTNQKQNLVAKVINDIANTVKEYVSWNNGFQKLISNLTPAIEKERAEEYLKSLGVEKLIKDISDLEKSTPWLRNLIVNFDDINTALSIPIEFLIKTQGNYDGFAKQIKSIIEDIKIKEDKDDKDKKPVLTPEQLKIAKENITNSGYVGYFKDLFNNPNEQISGNRTFLSLVSEHGNRDAAKAIIDLGANVNLPDIGNVTPLIYAANYGHPDIVKLLLDSGAKNTPDKNGRTALEIAKTKLTESSDTSTINAYTQIIELLK